jgi:hypothetical protein
MSLSRGVSNGEEWVWREEESASPEHVQQCGSVHRGSRFTTHTPTNGRVVQLCGAPHSGSGC